MKQTIEEFEESIRAANSLHVQQQLEGFEILLGWETRNKYRILDEQKRPIAFAAEVSTGLGGMLLRGILGHWRSFAMNIYGANREHLYVVRFPFRFFFKTLTIEAVDGRKLGHLQETFAIFRKKFDVFDAHGSLVAQINSSFFRFWTFDFFLRGQKLGVVKKKWAGVLSELFTDKDNFMVTYETTGLSADTKILMMATCLMVDIVYFENNQGKKRIGF